MTVPLVFDDVRLEGTRFIAVSLTVPPHQAVSVMGEVASGLDRLGRIAMGLEPAEGGRALLFGEDVGAMPRRAALAFRRQVGYVPEGDGLLQNLSLADNIALPLQFGSPLTPREVRGRVRVILGMFRLADVGDLRPSQADDEQRRRAAIARALVFDPSLVILDQPFDGIGLGAAAELLDLVRGGETPDGPRRSVLMTSQVLPERLRSRFEERYRVSGGKLRPDP